MALGTAVDSNVLSYPVLVFMKEQGVAVGRGGASPQALGETKPALNRRARRSLPSDVERGGANPQASSEAELALRRRARRSLSHRRPGEAESIFRCSGKKCSSVLV